MKSGNTITDDSVPDEGWNDPAVMTRRDNDGLEVRERDSRLGRPKSRDCIRFNIGIDSFVGGVAVVLSFHSFDNAAGSPASVTSCCQSDTDVEMRICFEYGLTFPYSSVSVKSIVLYRDCG